MCSTVMKGLRFFSYIRIVFRGLETFTYGLFRLLCGRFDNSQETRFQASKRSNMVSADLQGGRSADIHEFCFQSAKRAHLGCVEQQWSLFADCQKLHFQVSKLSDNCSNILQEGRFADVQE